MKGIGPWDVSCLIIFVTVYYIFVSLKEVLVCDVYRKAEHFIRASRVYSYLLTPFEDVHGIQLHDHLTIVL